jgi:uncharacterized protein YraI
MTLCKSMLLTALLLVSGAALAQTEMSAISTGDLEVRTGPGPRYPLVGLATRGSQAILDGCIKGGRWCRVQLESNGIRGWARAELLSVDENGSTVIVERHAADLGVPVVTYEQADTPDAVEPSPDDELIGPVGEVDAITPPQTVRTYIEENPAETVRLSGNVVVGAGLPDTVTVRRIPDYRYSYARINGQPVLIDPGTRRIVYVYR